MKETIESIIQWHRETFPDATLEGQICKFVEEMGEFGAGHSLEELADLYIVACGMCRFRCSAAIEYFAMVYEFLRAKGDHMIDLLISVENKMAENRNRDWNFKDGQYKHKES